MFVYELIHEYVWSTRAGCIHNIYVYIYIIIFLRKEK